jgi:teichoic acid transport system permease protein
MEVIKEVLNNLSRIWIMAKITVREEFRHAKLGIFWEVLRVGVFFTIYSIFFYFVRQVDDILHILGLLSVLVPFNLIVSVINQTPRIYRRNKVIVNTIKFPLSIMPIYDIIAKYLIHLITVIIIAIIFAFMNHISITFIQVIYYYICIFMLLSGLMFILSLVCSISDDAYKLWKVITRIFIYMNPIFWSISKLRNMNLPEWLINIIKLNPFVYIFEGFRKIVETESYNSFSENHIELFTIDTLIFWTITLSIFFIGVLFQKRVRKLLPDVI